MTRPPAALLDQLAAECRRMDIHGGSAGDLLLVDVGDWTIGQMLGTKGSQYGSRVWPVEIRTTTADALAQEFDHWAQRHSPAQWSVAEVAAHLDIKPRTVTAYTTRGQMPAPDGYVGRTPWWWETTITTWQAKRPGAGVRAWGRG